jgi:hypothetical protein
MNRHPDFTRIAFRLAGEERALVWDPVSDTLRHLAAPGRCPEPNGILDLVHQVIQQKRLTHVPAREVVSRALVSLGLSHEFVDCDPGAPGPESTALPPGAIA